MLMTTSIAPGAWIVVGASRGIGLEFVRQLLVSGRQVIAVVRNPRTASLLWQVAASQTKPGGCVIEQCDVTKEHEIEDFTVRLKKLVDGGLVVEGVILNSGVLNYPNRASETSFADFANIIKTNAIGPVAIAQKLINIQTISSSVSSTPPSPTTPITLRSPRPSCPPKKIIFISSDSGSMINFRDFEDGFAAYAASKSALNMMARHMAVELKKRGGPWGKMVVMCLHPGEVATDMGAIEVGWDVEGIISPQESVEGMIKVIDSKKTDDSGGFWCWDGRVSVSPRIEARDYGHVPILLCETD